MSALLVTLDLLCFAEILRPNSHRALEVLFEMRHSPLYTE